MSQDAREERERRLAELREDPLFNPLSNRRSTSEERLIEGFREIVEFYCQKGRLPSENGEGYEKGLYVRLKNDSSDPAKRKVLQEIDEHRILERFSASSQTKPTETKEPSTIAELINDPSGLFAETDDIFVLRHVKAPTIPEYIARAKRCLDFEPFEKLFRECRLDLVEGRRTISTFQRSSSIKKGTFLEIRGMLAFIAEVGEAIPGKERPQRRVRCVYDNGTETNDILDLSLAKAMYGKGGGKIISPNYEEILSSRMFNPQNGDQPTGWVYVLKSLSNDPKAKAFQNLHKIGFCSGKVEDRIKNAAQEPTYLMAKVQIVAKHEIFDVNPQKFEKTLHHFFKSARVSIDVFGPDGTPHTVREWFDLPLVVIQGAITKIQDRSIVNFQYDREEKALIEIGGDFSPTEDLES